MPFRIHPIVRVIFAFVLAVGITGRLLLLVLAQDAPSDASTPVAVDANPPTISQPGDLFAVADGGGGAVVNFDTPGASDDVDGTVGVSCDTASGTYFPLGASIVTCSATDSSGNSSSVSFTVTVADQAGR